MALWLLLPTHGYAHVWVRGTLQHPENDSVQLTYNSNRLAYYPQTFTARLDKQGNFALKLPVPTGGVYQLTELKHGNHVADLMLVDGDSLRLTVDVPHFDSTIHYTGRGSEVQNFVALHTVQRGRLNQYTVRLRNHLPETTAQWYVSVAQELKDEETYVQVHGAALPKAFTNIWLAHYRYYNYFFMQQYPQMHEMQRLRRYTDTIPAENYEGIDQMPLAFDDQYLQVPSYLLYLSGVFESRLRAAGYGLPVTDTVQARRLLDSADNLAYTTLPPASAEYYIAQGLYSRARVQRTDRSRQLLARFSKQWPQSEYLPLLTSQIELAERLSAGQPAPDFRVTMADGKKMMLSELKGKVVYVAFWATWCKPCVAEMRLLERKVKDLMARKPVEFVYVSLDDDTTAARMVPQQLKLTGNFTTTKGNWYAPEAKMYGLQSLPAYFLIDKDGKLATARPPSPQQATELMMAISKLL
jgi:peroxiredoxin